MCTQPLGPIMCFQSSILTTPRSTKFYKVVLGLKIARTSSPGITYQWRRCGSSCGRSALPGVSVCSTESGCSGSLSAVLLCCLRLHRRSDPRLFEAAAQRSASKGAYSNDFHSAGKSDQWGGGGGRPRRRRRPIAEGETGNRTVGRL